PCQCFVPAGTRTLVPGVMCTGSSPSAWYQPAPAVHSRIWSPAPPVPWWMCQLLRQRGSKVTLLTGVLPPTSGAEEARPVKYCAKASLGYPSGKGWSKVVSFMCPSQDLLALRSQALLVHPAGLDGSAASGV